MCAVQTASAKGKAPTWIAVCRDKTSYRGEMRVFASSAVGRRGNCAVCGHCIYMDYSAKHTIYIADALPHTPIAGYENGEFTADSDIYWKDRKPDAQRPAPIQFDEMPLGDPRSRPPRRARAAVVPSMRRVV